MEAEYLSRTRLEEKPWEIMTRWKIAGIRKACEIVKIDGIVMVKYRRWAESGGRIPK
jgi:hypothetical protein